MPIDNMKDTGVERALIAAIFKHGKNAFIDSNAIVTASDFWLPINRALYTCFSQMSDNDKCEVFDIESVKMTAKTLGIANFETDNKNLEYLELLGAAGSSKDNIPMFALQVKKFAVMRDLYSQYQNGIKELEGSNGNEPLSEIIARAEGGILDYISGSENTSLEIIGSDILNVVENMMESESVDQVGIPTGFPIFDAAIGGGPRRGTVNIIGARAKVGKTYLGFNLARNIVKKNIPVLYLDTELEKRAQQSRLMAIDSKVPIYLFETGKFKHNADMVKAIRASAQNISQMPFTYECVSGKNPDEILAIMRRWLIKKVGFDKFGRANDCVIILDYLKILDAKQITSYTPEHMALGFLITKMCGFAIKNSVPIISFVQLNRDGIDGEDTSIVASSDRILWLCSSLSFMKDKTDIDIAMGNPMEYGNKKIIVAATRYGAGLDEGDSINLLCSLKPGVGESLANGSIIEGYTYSKINTGRVQNNVSANKPRDNKPS